MFRLLFMVTSIQAAKISYWYGKVNQRYENGQWKSDEDLVSGADIPMLEYCQRFWPQTTKVVNTNQTEYITFCNRNVPLANCSQNSTKPVYECLGAEFPKISYWYGKVNQRFENGQWKSDEDMESGALIVKLQYCQKFWPSTVAVSTLTPTENITFCNKDTLHTECNQNNPVAIVDECIQPEANCCDDYSCFVPDVNAICCRAMTADCLACQAGVSTNAYCSVCPNLSGCSVPGNSALMTNTVILTGIGITVSATIAIGVIAAVL